MEEGIGEFGGTKAYFKKLTPDDTPKVTFILLHGKMFSIATWEELNTLNVLKEAGYKVFALDLPGYGRSKELSLGDVNPTDFMNEIIVNVGEGKVILVTPSMSGMYGIPYINAGAKGLGAWVPVAPIEIPTLNPPDDVKQHLRVLAYYGSEDGRIGDVATLEQQFNSFSKVIVPEGPHPVYLKDPELWHKTLIELAQELEGTTNA
eukprot:TRINITY_DN4467_c0_g1_i7.p2 TRINITY_DN4467_c0_g1~~TRINITY_DN4467_c0_g1_i7.p2  ORF type:complete len:205 (+),score=33.91 TRINITY_DN4467_c0_g1_i7:157-771(+)